MSDTRGADAADAPEPSVAELEAVLGYTYRDRALLVRALTHASHAHEAGEPTSNERLEFLGDSVIGLVVASLLYEAHPDWPEGDLTRALSRLVDARGLAALAKELGLGPHIRLGRTERQSKGSLKTSILADAMEALIGAMYLDGGLAPVEALVRRAYASALAADAPRVGRDPKTKFQEWVVAESGAFPRYRLVEDSGIDGDDERFTVEVLVKGVSWARGSGRSKQRAEQQAATDAYARREALRGEGLSGSRGAADGEAGAADV